MAIDSLASATNSIFQSSPSIKGTGRMDDNTGTALVPAEYKPGDNTLDAFHHELLLSQRSAYVNIISHDSTAFFSPGVTVDLDDVVLSFGFACTVHRNMALDQSIETCFADVSVMRARRWSTTWRTTKSVCRESMLICAGVCAMRSRGCTAGLRRRNTCAAATPLCFWMLTVLIVACCPIINVKVRISIMYNYRPATRMRFTEARLVSPHRPAMSA